MAPCGDWPLIARQIRRMPEGCLKEMGPVGRPPSGYEWQEGGWVHTTTRQPYSYEVYKAGVRKRQRDLERRRYHDPSTGTRARRRLRTEREAAARAREREAATEAWKRPKQLTLDQARSDDAGINQSLLEIDNTWQH